MLPWQRAAKARAGMDRDESTTMDCDIAIYQTVYADADADSDGPGSDRGRAQADLNVNLLGRFIVNLPEHGPNLSLQVQPNQISLFGQVPGSSCLPGLLVAPADFGPGSSCYGRFGQVWTTDTHGPDAPYPVCVAMCVHVRCVSLVAVCAVHRPPRWRVRCCKLEGHRRHI